jgi:hypothetical protein
MFYQMLLLALDGLVGQNLGMHIFFVVFFPMQLTFEYHHPTCGAPVCGICSDL